MTDNILNIIVNKSSIIDNIRTVILVGSRAQPHGMVDRLSDYDVTLFVKNVDQFINSEKQWINSFGKPLLVLNEKAEIYNQLFPTRLVQYQNNLKIDFAVYTIEILKEIIARRSMPGWMEAGYRIIVDKDHLDSELNKIPQKLNSEPDQKQFDSLVNEFYWECIYIAKFLKRGELVQAKYSDHIMKNVLMIHMLEWYARSTSNNKIITHSSGKNIEHWLEIKVYKKYLHLFKAHSIKEHWQSLFQAISLYQEISKRVAEKNGLVFPSKTNDDCLKIIKDYHKGSEL